MQVKLLTTLAMVCLASAQQIQVTSMFIYGADPQPLVASLMWSDGYRTMYSINCPDGTPPGKCGMGLEGLTLTAEPERTMYKYDGFPKITCSGDPGFIECYQPSRNEPAIFENPQFLPVTVTGGEDFSGFGRSPATAATPGATATTGPAAGEPTETGTI